MRDATSSRSFSRRPSSATTKSCKFWDLNPALDLLQNRDANEAYAAAQPGRSLVIYFPNGGDVKADLRMFSAEGEVRWLDISGPRWERSAKIRAGEWVSVKAPSQGSWVALIQADQTGK
jgi:hypothetical protein